MILFNYSGLRNRDSKIYSVGGYNIAGGFSIQFLYVVGPVFLFFILIGWLLSMLFGLSFFNPFADNFKAGFTITFLVIGILVGCAMWYIKIAGYRLYQYLIAYFKPKKVYTNDFKTKEFKLTNFSIKTFVKTIL